MKLLYVNGTFEGGSLMSTRQLLAHLPGEVEAHLVRAKRESAPIAYLRRRSTNLAVKLGGFEQNNSLQWVTRLWGRQPNVVGTNEWSSIAVENAARTYLSTSKPDIVVVSSVDRMAWRRIRHDTATAGIPCVLYLREESLLHHLALTDPPDLVLANSRGLVHSAETLGWAASLVPSVVDLSSCEVESDRTKALLLNPTAAYGLDLAVRVAKICPALDFVFQESTRLTAGELSVACDIAARLPNVEFRAFTSDVAQVYRDARVLLAPYTEYLESNRPRSVLEAHHNGIPVVGTSRAGLRDAVGAGGVLLSPDASAEEWASVLLSVDSNNDFYDELIEQSRMQASRPEVDTGSIVALFISTTASILD